MQILEANACPDHIHIHIHIHILVAIPPQMSISSFIRFLKGKSSLTIILKFLNLKYKYGNRHFWCRGYYVSIVGRNKKVIEQYIKGQLHEDLISYQISLKEYTDPFKESK